MSEMVTDYSYSAPLGSLLTEYRDGTTMLERLELKRLITGFLRPLNQDIGHAVSYLGPHSDASELLAWFALMKERVEAITVPPETPPEVSQTIGTLRESILNKIGRFSEQLRVPVTD